MANKNFSLLSATIHRVTVLLVISITELLCIVTIIIISAAKVKFKPRPRFYVFIYGTFLSLITTICGVMLGISWVRFVQKNLLLVDL